jgi:RND superfamily putative drug exporter
MVGRISRKIVAWRWWVLAAWVVAGAGLSLLAPPAEPIANELASFLPTDCPSVRAEAALARHFPDNAGLSQAVIVIERTAPATTKETPPSPYPLSSRERGEEAATPAPTQPEAAVPHATTSVPASLRLTEADRQALDGLAARIAAPLPAELAAQVGSKSLSVRSPSDLGLVWPNPLLSRDGQAATAQVEIPANFISVRSARLTAHIRDLVAKADWPAGLNVHVTGSAGFGADYALATESSHHRTMWVTVLAVLAILLVVYRAPLAALAVLVTISMAAFVASYCLLFATSLGLHVGTAEKIFVFVLLYGAGVDYSLLYLSRFREECRLAEPRVAATAALQATLPTILASAGTVIAGLVMLTAARFEVFKTTGKSVSFALGIAVLAVLTLAPAAAAILHRRLFWPSRRTETLGQRRLWPKVAGLVTRRPGLVLIVTLAALALPAWQATRMQFSYDSISGLAPHYDAVQGVETIKRHWTIGQVLPTVVLVEADTPAAQAQLPDAARRLTMTLLGVEGVTDVRSRTLPAGRDAAGVSLLSLLPGPAKRIDKEYVGAGGKATRLVVMLDASAFSARSMQTLGRIESAVEAKLGPGFTVSYTGSTAEMLDTRNVTQRDFYRVAALALAAIFLIVLALVRDAVLSAFMVASTVVSYLATLGVAWVFFVGCLGQGGLDWKLEVMLFVVMVAVGQDYNIFLAARLAEESRRADPREAARLAIVKTGGIISSAGLIMAATLGSLAVGDIMLLVQLGFAFAVGMLLDTFIVRPLLLPAFAVLTGRTGRSWT